jgi:hypothetical protein
MNPIVTNGCLYVTMRKKLKYKTQIRDVPKDDRL